MSLQMRLLRR